jgi:hypothetical protein
VSTTSFGARQRRGKVLVADTRRGGGAHGEHALGAERIRMAGTRLGRRDGGECDAGEGKQKANHG